MRTKTNLSYTVLTIIYMILILAASLKPGTIDSKGGVAGQVIVNILHIPAYGIMAYLILRCFSIISYKAYIIAFAASALHGASVEFLQVFIPRRSASLMDTGLNSIGIILTLALVIASERKRAKQSQTAK